MQRIIACLKCGRKWQELPVEERGCGCRKDQSSVTHLVDSKGEPNRRDVFSCGKCGKLWLVGMGKCSGENGGKHELREIEFYWE